jgi:glycosyltransferase involved in cell wall biosynthesis
VKHYKGNGIDRMISIFQFAWRVYRWGRFLERPDVIIHNIHAPFDYPVSWCAKQMKANYIVEAWDLWPDSFVRFGLIGENNPLTKMAYAIERILYEKADKIIFTLEGGADYLKNRRWTKEFGGMIDEKKVFYINNGVNLDKFDADVERHQLQDHDLDATGQFNVIYLGSVRLVNNLKQLIDAAHLLKNVPNIKFLIYGDGDYRDTLEQYCRDQRIENVVFKEKWIPFQNVPFVLSRASLNILNYQKDFGIYGVSSGKLFLYLAAGKPICSNIKMNYCLIEKYGLGIAKNLETPQEYAKAILSVASLDDVSYQRLSTKVRATAKQFDYKVVSAKLLDVIELSV